MNSLIVFLFCVNFLLNSLVVFVFQLLISSIVLCYNINKLTYLLGLFECMCNSEIAEITTGCSKRCICVSTLREAEVFAEGGYDDILFAAHFGPDKIPRYVTLQQLFCSTYRKNSNIIRTLV